MNSTPRRVAISHEIHALADEMAGRIDRLDWEPRDRADAIADAAADVEWAVRPHDDPTNLDLRGQLINLAAECLSWLEAIDAEAAR